MDKAIQTYLFNPISTASDANENIWAHLKSRSSILIYAAIGCSIGLFALSFSIKITLGLLILLILGFIGLIKPEIVAIVLGFLLPFHLEWEMPQLAGIKVGTTSLLVAVGFISILLNRFLNRKTRLPRIPHIIPWSLLALFMCAAYIHSPYFSSDPAKIPWHLYRSVLRFLLIFPLIFVLLQTKSQLLSKNMIWMILVSTTIAGLGGIVQTTTGTPWHPFHYGINLESLLLYKDLFTAENVTGVLRAFGPFTHPNGFAGYLVITIAISLGILFCTPRNRLWHVTLVSLAVQITALLCTMSRGGWVAFSGSTVLMGILAKKKKVIGMGAGILALAFILMPSTQKSKIASRAKSISKPSQVEEFAFRQKRWDTFLEIAFKNPILGTGMAVLDNPNEGEVGQTPHNMYLYFAVQNGIPALILLVYFLGQLCYWGFVTFQRTQNHWYRAIALGGLGAGIGLFIHGAVDALIGLEQIWTAFWVLFAMIIFVAEQNRGSTKIYPNVYQ